MSAPELDEGVLDLTVRSMTVEATGVMTIELVDAEGGLLPEWTPGAHIDLGFPDVIRQYSLCGDPADRLRYVVAVLREPASRGGSEYVHAELRPGDVVEVGGPRNHFALEQAKRYLFIAGGIGITPIVPMIRAAAAADAEWRLVYGGRSRDSMALRDQLERYGDNVTLQPEDESGRLDVAELLATPIDGVAIYCCGPSGLIEAVASAAQHWLEGALHVERFTAKDLSGLDSEPISLKCVKSDVEMTVAADESVLDALESAGIGVPNACREGVCGSCEIAVLAGVPEHRDSYRTPTDDDVTSMAVCVSRARTPELVLDI